MKSEEMPHEEWDLVLSPARKWVLFPFKEVWRYRDLLTTFVRRDIVVVYKQTVLGPVWFFIQPILTTAVYLLIFGNIARLSSDGLPRILFYSSGVVIWNFFSETFSVTSKTFTENANLFGKVYFPRIILPLSKVLSGLIKFGIQFAFFLIIFFYYYFQGTEIHPRIEILFVPVLLLLMAMLGVGFGVIFTSLTTKYRDLTFLIQFGIQLMMYATPVIYPLSAVPEKYRPLILANPITSIVEGFRFTFLGSGYWSWAGLAYTGVFSLVILLTALLIFNRVERTFMDTV